MLFGEETFLLRRKIDSLRLRPNVSVSYAPVDAPSQAGHSSNSNAEDATETQRLITETTGEFARWRWPSLCALVAQLISMYSLLFSYLLFLDDIKDHLGLDYCPSLSILAFGFAMQCISRISCVSIIMPSVSARVLVLLCSIIGSAFSVAYMIYPVLPLFTFMIGGKFLCFGIVTAPTLTLVGHYFHGVSAVTTWLSATVCVVLVPSVANLVHHFMGFDGLLHVWCFGDIAVGLMSIVLVSRTWISQRFVSREELDALSQSVPLRPGNVQANQNVLITARDVTSKLRGNWYSSNEEFTEQSVIDSELCNIAALDDIGVAERSTSAAERGQCCAFWRKMCTPFRMVVYTTSTSSSERSWNDELGTRCAVISHVLLRVSLVLLVLFPSFCIQNGASMHEATVLCTMAGISFLAANVTYRWLYLGLKVVRVRTLVGVSAMAMAVACVVFTRTSNSYPQQAIFAVLLGSCGLTSIGMSAEHLTEYAKAGDLTSMMKISNLCGTLLLAAALPIFGFFADSDSIGLVFEFMAKVLVVGGAPCMFHWIYCVYHLPPICTRTSESEEEDADQRQPSSYEVI